MQTWCKLLADVVREKANCSRQFKHLEPAACKKQVSRIMATFADKVQTKYKVIFCYHLTTATSFTMPLLNPLPSPIIIIRRRRLFNLSFIVAVSHASFASRRTSLTSGDVPGSSSLCAYTTSAPSSTNVPPKRRTPSGGPRSGSSFRMGASVATLAR